MGKRELQHLLDALGLANYNKMREYIRMEEILKKRNKGSHGQKAIHA
jgi:hypothetical protein